MSIKWNLKEQADRAEKSVNEMPAWIKDKGYFAGSDSQTRGTQQTSKKGELHESQKGGNKK